MNTINRKRAQLSVIAVAALAVFAVAAVMLLAGGNPAQADTANLAPDGGERLWPEQPGTSGPGPGGETPTPEPTEEPTPEPPQQTQPEACSDSPAHVVSSGHYALFEAYWDAADENLVNNPCPPRIRQELGAGITTTQRQPTDVNIGHTVIHVPAALKQTVTASGEGDFDGGEFDFLREPTPRAQPAASAEVWIVPSCAPEPERVIPADRLCIGFSAGLLQQADWDGDVQYEFESIREPEVNPGDRGAIYAFHAEGVPDGEDRLTWTTFDADTNELLIAPGRYEHRAWAFTKPGTYQVVVHVKGRPKPHRTEGLPAITSSITVTSEVRTYTFHVGSLSRLGVGVAAAPADATDTSLDPGDDVTITVAATNAGPDPAPATEVEVSLPEGLAHQSSTTATGSSAYDPDENKVAWTLGTLNAPAAADAAPIPATLTITARVKEGYRGHPQDVAATIKATETVGNSSFTELDPFEDDNSATATITPTALDNDKPLFEVVRDVAANAAENDPVGAPVSVWDSNGGDTLAFSLDGPGADNFEVANPSGQISVAADAGLGQNCYYRLVLAVSDGKDEFGNANTDVDEEASLRINVPDATNATTPCSE